jgi:hypothetical protein
MITVDLAAALALFAARPVAVEVASRPAAIRATERKVRFAFIFLSLLYSSFDAGNQTGLFRSSTYALGVTNLIRISY